MKRLLLFPLFVSAVALAADLPKIPSESIATKKEELFADDFQGAEPAKVWHKVVPTFVVEAADLYFGRASAAGTATVKDLAVAYSDHRRGLPRPLPTTSIV